MDVGGQGATQVVFFGTETFKRDVAVFVIPIDVLGGGFFLLLAVAMIGPGQELGRALNRVHNRVLAYTWNILGSIVGILLFAACSWWQLPPQLWFAPIVLGLGYFLILRGQDRSIDHGAIFLVFAPSAAKQRQSIARSILIPTGIVVALALLPWLAGQTGGSRGREGNPNYHFWSPYYRIDFEPSRRLITTNLIGHQTMESCSELLPAYALPHLLHRDALRQSGVAKPEPFRNVLIIGAGSGNDVARRPAMGGLPRRCRRDRPGDPEHRRPWSSGQAV